MLAHVYSIGMAGLTLKPKAVAQILLTTLNCGSVYNLCAAKFISYLSRIRSNKLHCKNISFSILQVTPSTSPISEGLVCVYTAKICHSDGSCYAFRYAMLRSPF